MTTISTMPFDPGPVLARMKAFQRKTVDHVFNRLYLDEAPTSRFLVADEVGLGKTLVARGVIARALEHLHGSVKRIDVVYVCSNAAIARQNIARLNVTGREDFALSTRLTLLPSQLRLLDPSGVNFISFTPGTTFDIKNGGGRKEERAVLYALLRLSGLANAAGLSNLLRGSVGTANWKSLAAHTARQALDQTLRERFLAELRADAVFVERLAEGADRHRYRRAEPDRDGWKLIGELRSRLARTCLDALEPDLIILDEFQRFKSLLGTETEAAQLAQHLFARPTARVLLLSATPYAMLSLDHESESDHYADFLATLRFLFNDPSQVESVRRELDVCRSALLDLPVASTKSASRAARERATAASAALRARLLPVMCRTERVGITKNRDSMLREPAVRASIAAPDLMHARLLLGVAETLGTYDTIEFWKSGDYVLNFMRDYEVGKRLERRRDEAGVAEAIWRMVKDGRAHLLTKAKLERYEPLEPASGRMRYLLSETIGRDLWRLLWLPPSMPYTRPHGEYEAVGDVSKLLVFSSWNFVPDAISVVTSYEAERRMVGEAQARVGYSELNQRIHRLLQFNVRPRETADGEVGEQLSGMTALALQYPSPSLAALVDPLRLVLDIGRGRPISVATLVRETERRLAPIVAELVERHALSDRPDKRWYWALPALLDQARFPSAIDWVRRRDGWLAIESDTESRAGDSGAGKSPVGEDGFGQHVRHFHAAALGGLSLGRPPRDLARVIAELALAGPAVCALRAMRRVAPELEWDAFGLLNSAARVAGGFRTLFNLPDTVSLLRSSDGDEAYWRRVLQYCLDGNLQAVLDEQVHGLPESLGVTDRPAQTPPVATQADSIGRATVGRVEEIAATLASALSIRTSQLRVEEIKPRRGQTAVDVDHFTVRCRFGLRFAQIKDEREGTLNRIETVRDAFNSPFRPFVLATTSIGQEGLDFHTWCHKVVHWNLPSNPVDLEQREGRVHRYKGHAVRKNVARRYGLRALSEGLATGDWNVTGDPWAYLFSRAATDTSAATQDLSPYWVFETKGGAEIERLVPLLPFSREVAQLDALKRSLAVYRLAFGQPRQEDLIRFLTNQVGGDGTDPRVSGMTVSLMP